MNHSDFHFKNVMILKINKPRNYVYYIDDKKYTVEAKTYVPVIIDINGNLTGQKINQMKDINKLCKQMKKFIPEIWYKLDISLESSTVKKFFERNFDEYKSPYNRSAQISNDIRLHNKYKYTFF
jgi:hypothetical protein